MENISGLATTQNANATEGNARLTVPLMSQGIGKVVHYSTLLNNPLPMKEKDDAPVGNNGNGEGADKRVTFVVPESGCGRKVDFQGYCWYIGAKGAKRYCSRCSYHIRKLARTKPIG